VQRVSERAELAEITPCCACHQAAAIRTVFKEGTTFPQAVQAIAHLNRVAESNSGVARFLLALKDTAPACLPMLGPTNGKVQRDGRFLSETWLFEFIIRCEQRSKVLLLPSDTRCAVWILPVGVTGQPVSSATLSVVTASAEHTFAGREHGTERNFKRANTVACQWAGDRGLRVVDDGHGP
jgi:hypothetical protein